MDYFEFGIRTKYIDDNNIDIVSDIVSEYGILNEVFKYEDNTVEWIFEAPDVKTAKEIREIASNTLGARFILNNEYFNKGGVKFFIRGKHGLQNNKKADKTHKASR